MKFTDGKGREWNASITIGAVRRIRNELKLDLLDDGKALVSLGDDVEQMVNVLYLLCKPQADADKITDEEFGESMTGDAIASAMNQFMDELADFSPNPIRRKVMRKALDRTRALEDRAASMLMAKLDDPKMTDAIDKLVNQAGEQFTESLDTWGSTPANSPSVN